MKIWFVGSRGFARGGPGPGVPSPWKLQQAAKNQNMALEDLGREADKQSSAMCSFRVNMDDAKADVANLAYLFEFTHEKRISEQDDEIEKLLQLQDSVASPAKKGGDATPQTLTSRICKRRSSRPRSASKR